FFINKENSLIGEPVGEDRGVVALIALITPHHVAFARLGHPVRRALRIYGYKFLLAKKSPI
ncbi:MAG: hypothetical protein Q8906_12490, partial [Bacillota bacterium]|nr:hypothetical protein [Bacillota bacterium]